MNRFSAYPGICAILAMIHCGGSTTHDGTTLPDGDTLALDGMAGEPDAPDADAPFLPETHPDVVDDQGQDADVSADREPPTDAPPDSDGGTSVDPGDVKPDGDGGPFTDSDSSLCCPISPGPACCMEYGGSGFCGVTCDGMPWPSYPGWERRIDANGCPYWWTPPDAPRGCGIFPDVHESP